MDFTDENFPLYGLMEQFNLLTEPAARDLKRARLGDDETRYYFAAGLYSAATMPGLESMFPGAFRESVRQRTLQSCREVFEELGARGHARGAEMAARCHLFGEGCEESDTALAKMWLDKAEKLGGTTFMTAHLRALFPTPRGPLPS